MKGVVIGVYGCVTGFLLWIIKILEFDFVRMTLRPSACQCFMPECVITVIVTVCVCVTGNSQVAYTIDASSAHTVAQLKVGSILNEVTRSSLW